MDKKCFPIVTLVVNRKPYFSIVFSNLNAGLAQSVERQALNLMVEGSSPSVGVLLPFFLFFAVVPSAVPRFILFQQSPACADPNFEFLCCVVPTVKNMISPGIEPGTFSVLTKCDNRYTTKPFAWEMPAVASLINRNIKSLMVKAATQIIVIKDIFREHNGVKILFSGNPMNASP